MDLRLLLIGLLLVTLVNCYRGDHFLTSRRVVESRSKLYENETRRSLKLLGVEVPVYKFRGEDADLECKYEVGRYPLYSVQWYKDDSEFFRYMFRNIPPKKVFPIPGIKVDMNRSNERRVLLQDVTFQSTGTYRCEVSADAPHFRTYTNQSRMVVVELPKHRPQITGAKSHYRVGETALLNCTSSKSKPAAKLSWFINDEKPDERNIHYYPTWVHSDGLESIRLGLFFTVRASHFVNGDLALKCQATVSTIYSDANEQDAQIVYEPVILEQKENRIFIRSAAATMLSLKRDSWLVVLLLLGLLGLTDIGSRLQL